jgi:hypothetical protein
MPKVGEEESIPLLMMKSHAGGMALSAFPAIDLNCG